MSIESIISHVGSPEHTLEVLNTDTRFGKELRKFSLEFCHAFNVKVAHAIPREGTSDTVRSFLNVITPSGVPCGSINVSEDRDGVYYKYCARHISKEKASSRSTKNERDSSKISTLIQSIRRNKEAPSNEFFYKNDGYGITCALRSIVPHDSAEMNLKDKNAVYELVKYFLGYANAAEGYRDMLSDAYNKYLEANKANSAHAMNKRRFVEGGATVVAVYSLNGSGGKPVYVTGDLTVIDEGNYKYELRNLKGGNDVSGDTQLTTLAMMSRAYFSGNQSPHCDNLFGVPLGDRYWGDLDIATGYSTTQVLWMLVPKTPSV